MASKQKKNTNAPLLIIILIAVVIVVAIFIMKNRNKTTESTTTAKAGSSTSSSSASSEEEENMTLIDMNNTENAKISGGVKENTSTNLLKDKTFRGMKVTDIKLVAEDGVSRFTATVENNSGSDYEGGNITMVFTNADGSEYARLKGVLPAIQKGDTNEIDAKTTDDVINAYDFTIQ